MENEKEVILRYKNSEISLGKAAERLGIHRHEMQILLMKWNVPLNYGMQEFEQDLKTIDLLWGKNQEKTGKDVER